MLHTRTGPGRPPVPLPHPTRNPSQRGTAPLPKGLQARGPWGYFMSALDPNPCSVSRGLDGGGGGWGV